ncbi:MAG TPA: o-succinylbenzoate synthase [Candidatus Bathyarchaeia archaeon]|nr:o-succinylbenzoate synthase [Candidatus Bathyarchaeia archaeon]
MKIEKIVLRELKMPLVTAFETSGWRETEKDCILIEMRSDAQVGYGECAVSPGPWYGPETITSAWHVMENYFIPSVIGREFESPTQFLGSLGSFRGNNMAKAGFEMAFYDLKAREEGKSMSKMLGGVKPTIKSGVSVGIQPGPKQLVDVISKYLDQGYRRIKLKIKPGNDKEQISIVRNEFRDIMLTADANGAYNGADFESLVALDKYQLLMLEQPFAWDDLVDHANLQRAIQTPICLDESVDGINELKTALALQSCGIVNIKPARVGGLTISKTMQETCMSQRIPVWCGGLLETGVGRAHNIAVASLPGFVMPNDISASNRYFEHDIVSPEFRLNSDGTITVPTKAGIGVEMDQDRLEENTRNRKQFS